MGWLWGSDNGSDAQDQLDPSLRDFLKTEAPTGPKPALPSAPKPKAAEPTLPPTQATDPSKPVVPPQSQFQDGRYAGLWKNYTPQNIVDDRGKSDQDRLRDLIDGYNDRKSAVGRVAMENCAQEYMEQFECFRHPATWWSAGTMCIAESRKFNRCHEIQSKFLKALGYMTMDARSPEEDERIQMHADKLYQEMLRQEKAIAKAKEEGLPVPTFKKRSEIVLADEENIWARIKQDTRIEYEKKLAKLPPEEQEIERMAVLGELKSSTGVAKQVEEVFIAERIARMKRKAAGQATFGDTIKSWWGWG